MEEQSPAVSIRAVAGGVLMGLANLVPGISGGTMLVATGVYARFVEAVAEVTTLRIRVRSLLLLGTVGLSAIAAIVLLAGPVKDLVRNQQWVMYSLFIGLTLGGIPIVWRMARPGSVSLVLGALAGLAAMAGMALSSYLAGPDHTGGSGGMVLLFVAGVAGASAMILPGISGAYLLLVLGQYETILGAVDQMKRGEFGPALGVVIPVGLGVVVGIVGVSNLVRFALKRYEQTTLGVLLGLLLGSVLGLWPFQYGVQKTIYAPGANQVVAAVLLVGVGLAITLLIDRASSRTRNG